MSYRSGDAMAVFRPTCRQCYIERGQTILLDEAGVCPVNLAHRTIDDIVVA